MTFRIFISSVQDEFAEERRRLKQWLTNDLFVSRFVESVFLFEDVPSRGIPPQEVFLDEVKSSDIYIGFIGSQYYGKASMKRGVSATEQEYDAAGGKYSPELLVRCAASVCRVFGGAFDEAQLLDGYMGSAFRLYPSMLNAVVGYSNEIIANFPEPVTAALSPETATD